MSLDYSAIEDAIVAVFAADDWLKIVAGNVKVIEARVRENADTDKALIWGLARDTELPGIIVYAETARRVPITTGEHDNFIPITVMAFTSVLKRTTAKAARITLVENLERVIEKQVASGQDWGTALATTEVPTIRTEPTLYKEGDNYIGEAEITFEILKITDIEGI
jgi:hypothetical protein